MTFRVSCTCQGSEPGSGSASRAARATDSGLLAGGPDRELAAQPAAAHDIDDDPGRELPGQQARAPLQGQRFAERAVLQEQPGHRGQQIHPARHRPHGLTRWRARPPGRAGAPRPARGARCAAGAAGAAGRLAGPAAGRCGRAGGARAAWCCCGEWC